MRMAENFDIYNGVKVIKGWGKEIALAQTRQETKINGKVVKRIPFGKGSLDSGNICSECAVLKGQIHVMGCDYEQCPICGDSLIYCKCNNEENM